MIWNWKMIWNRKMNDSGLLVVIDFDDEQPYHFMIERDGRRFYTNSERRWMRHLRICRKRRAIATYYRWDGSSQWESPQFRPRAHSTGGNF